MLQTQDYAATKQAKHADAQVISFPKMGRTLLDRMYQFYCCKVLQGISPSADDVFHVAAVSRIPSKKRCFHEMLDNGAKRGAVLPRVKFRHPATSKAEEMLKDPMVFLRVIKATPAVFLVRDPRDTVVSYFYHARHYRSKTITTTPPDDISLFVRDPAVGIPMICRFLQAVAAISKRKKVKRMVLSFEDMLSDKGGALQQFLQFSGLQDIDADAVQFAVEESDFSLSQAREIEFRRATTPDNGLVTQNALRARKGKVGGYRDELEPGDIAWINDYLEQTLPLEFRAAYLEETVTVDRI